MPTATTIKKKKKKSSGSGESSDGVLVNEPTMGEKLATLNLITDSDSKQQQIAATQPQPPSADSVQVLLRQALRADDRVLLLDCLYNRDEKVIAKSVSLLSPADVLKLLQSLISIIQSRYKPRLIMGVHVCLMNVSVKLVDPFSNTEPIFGFLK
nr:uncharacterized protein LOC112015005 [Quercus suber]